jgi:menaquinone-dependent protoporphyrinogen oxidase
MKVLVVAASRHGSTAEIARAVGVRLRERGHDVDVHHPTEVSAPDGYDAVIIGSAIYAGNWLKDARKFIETNTDALSAERVWLFSSGPLDGAEAKAISDQRIDRLTSATGSLSHHVFAGRLDRSQLNRSEQLLTKIVHAPDGDFRDWDDVATWADQIADTLD